MCIRDRHRVGPFESLSEKWDVCKTGFRKAYKQVFSKDIAVSSVRSVAQPVPQRNPKRGPRKRPGHMPWQTAVLRRSDIDMAVVGNLPLHLKRHLFLLHRAGKLDEGIIQERGFVEVDFFGDAKGDSFRAFIGHVVQLSLHITACRSPQALTKRGCPSA